MNIFISWSKEYSKEVAGVFRKWIKQTLQLTIPFMSESDIDLGLIPLEEIDKNLKKADMGIIIVTKENLNSPWLNYESGAIATKISGTNKVIPVLIDIKVEELGSSPLTKFQVARDFNKNEIYKLVVAINNELGEMKLSTEALDETFEMWWPKLEQQISEIILKYKSEQKKYDGSSSEKEKEDNKFDERISYLMKSNDRNSRILEEVAMSITALSTNNREELSNMKNSDELFYIIQKSLQIQTEMLVKARKQLLKAINNEMGQMDELTEVLEIIEVLLRKHTVEFERNIKKYNMIG
ncbi:TIR domain-containing protein [Erysipelothrix rhusiopathiae]|nr:toll/interleukin-1 receptor domain-containing protein [Erysipelothrix rhusiopathiae]RNM29232.1 TIR domain-containing protein [Erysipelothrix rhusiopathiae]